MIMEARPKRPENEIRPQPGPQEAFLATSADIAIFGGGAGGGKTFGLLLECLRHRTTPRFGAVIFRRDYTQITSEGGMWDASESVYQDFGGIPKETTLEWTFGRGQKSSRVKFAHMQYDKDRYKWDGSEIPLICFDQLEHFSAKMFFYMLSRNRSTCGVRPYIRATCNPNPDHWLRHFLSWWIDEKTGLPIPERSGVVRWFVNLNNEIHWADTREELLEDYGPETMPKSATFIAASVYDNKILLEKDPGYLANLNALSYVDRERLLGGNWNIREAAGTVFQREWFEIVDAAPSCPEEWRYWDRAATAQQDATAKSSHTVGVLMGRSNNGMFFVKDVRRFQGTPATVMRTIKNVASQDGKGVVIGIEQDPAQAGKAEAEAQIRNLAGYIAHANTVRESKGNRAKPLSAQAEAGNVKVVRGTWNEAFLNELENFDGTDKCMADQVDASSGAFYMLTSKTRCSVPPGDFSNHTSADPKSEVFAGSRFTFSGGWDD